MVFAKRQNFENFQPAHANLKTAHADRGYPEFGPETPTMG